MGMLAPRSGPESGQTTPAAGCRGCVPASRRPGLPGGSPPRWHRASLPI